MSPETCNRVPEALAANMVWGDAALLEHAKSCEICATQLVALKKRREFRDAFPVLSSIADEAPRPSVTTDDARARAARRRHVLLMITAVIAILLFIGRNRVFRAPQALEGAEAALGAPRFRIFNLANALFESKVEGQTVRSRLTRGVAAFQVDRLTSDQRFLLTLPDGELEVRGTRFVVTVEGEKTQGVDVSDGTVALRLHGGAEIVLSAGDRWPADSTRPTVSFIDLAPSPRGDAGTRDPSKSKP